MTVRFGNNRLGFYVAVFILSGTVLGLAANFASIFLPHLHNNFIIFALVVPSLTIFSFLLSLQWAQPNTEALQLFILGILWLAMGAWATDVIGPLQCDALGGQTMPAKNGGETNFQAYCYEMKVIQAFSWALFIMFVVALWILFQLAAQAERFGRYQIWREPIRELPWFGEMPGYYNTSTMGAAPMQYYPSSGGMYGPQPGNPYGGYPQPAPGHTLVIQPGMNGAPPTITQMPMNTV
ncbi:hypothetical protein HYPSUDRAFT_32413 [Hypholoma sublateritium FD-334 SS-4]|uniref:MARVEL domain-containing protein n=1 Tax=Hypholoma sublateritium (strain FD-334 SS-4) TaxID=945553 RepID=A0A0D2PHC4_HYPSF|nr:hypothetical protein HYPSUDRAFT_32413 [Hypholoma sublateritium FD-334 SS-4]